MKKFAFFAVAAALMLAGCGKDDDGKFDGELDLTIDLDEVDLTVGSTYQLTTTVIASPADLKYNVVWESSAPDIVSVDVATGMLKVAKNDTINESYVGEVEITATATAVDYPGMSSSCDCTVYVNFHDHYDNSFYYLGETYKTVTLKDGNTWMAENLRYVPADKTASSDYTVDAGVWNPAGADKVADPSLVGKKGYLSDCATAFGVDAITEENAMSFEGKRGICPKGWHIPTNAELTGLVGQNANGALTDTTAPYYDADTKGAPIDALNADGFNWTYVGIRNKTTLTGAGSYTCTVYEDAVGALSYVLGSTCYQIKKDATGNVTNYQYYSLMSTYNKSFKRVTVAYGNVLAGMSVRCIKDKE